MGRVMGRVGNPDPSPSPNPDPTPTPNQVNGYEVVPERLGALLADVAQGELAALAAEATKVAKWQPTLTPSPYPNPNPHPNQVAKWRQEGPPPREGAAEAAVKAAAEAAARGVEGTAAPPSGGGRQLTVLPAALTTKGGWLQPGGFSFAKVVTGEVIALKRTLTLTLNPNPNPNPNPQPQPSPSPSPSPSP